MYKLVVSLLLLLAPVSAKRRVLLVKVGGSSITDKATRERLNQDALQWLSQTLSQDYLYESNHLSETCGETSLILIHGAGSFGHHTAKEFGLKGKTEAPHPLKTQQDQQDNFLSTDDERSRRRTLHGLAQTRISVQTLNRHVVAALVEKGMNAVGMSPCFAIPGMQAHGGDESVRSSLRKLVRETLDAGLVPVLHGDACLYHDNKDMVGILSGDVLMEMLGTADWVDHAVFLTDVDGVYTRDPRLHADAQLLRTIKVTGGGQLELAVDATGSTHQHDVTGGLKTKLASAATIVSSGTNVTIARCGSISAERVLLESAADDTVGDTALNATLLYGPPVDV